jgi:nucleotidyltransferase/DNA polymerase involved in DNA repair
VPGRFGIAPRGSEKELICVIELARAIPGSKADAALTTSKATSTLLTIAPSIPPGESTFDGPIRVCEHTFVSVTVCILVPRFELLTAVGTREELIREAIALAPEPDREQVVGEVSGAAEAAGVHAGMRLGEALARCPDLRLVAADPAGAAAAWEAVLDALERIGAAIESPRAGEAYFEAGGLRRLYGGNLEGVLARSRRAIAMPARIGAAASRFCAFAAASRARAGRAAQIVPAGVERAFLAPLPVALLRARPEAVARGSRGADLCAVLERLGVRTLGDLAALPANDVADRFGRAGLHARELALGRDTPLEPRAFRERLSERIDLPEAVSGPQLERSLELLIDRLLARAERRGRSFRRLRLGARFVEQGTWRREVAMREATAARERLQLALAPKLAELPAPVDRLSLAALSFGPPVADQLSFRAPDEVERRKRLGEALRQTRAAAGQEALLRVLEVDPGSRIPERRILLTPFPE